MSEPTSSLPIPIEPPVALWVIKPRRQMYWLHALLLAATFLTTTIVGARLEFNYLHNLPTFAMGDEGGLPLFPVRWILSQPSRLWLGLPFSLTLMFILLAHEMGHYLYCRFYGVQATLPYFIPAPTLIGTLGAFIRIRGAIRSRTALFDIGIAGPIAGFVVALGALACSLGLSRPFPLGAGPESDLGFPLIFLLVHRVLAFLSHGVAGLPLSQVVLHPMAIAAWVGMFATALNLLPGGQLDGGHIVFSLSPKLHKWVSRLTILVLAPMAVYYWAGWLVWAVLLGLSSMRHPRVADWPRVSGKRGWLAVLALLMLILTLTPAPFVGGSLRAVVHELRGR